MNHVDSESSNIDEHFAKSVRIANLGTVVRLQSHPRYNTQVGLFMPTVRPSDVIDASIDRWQESTRENGMSSRKRRIDAALSLASGLDVIYGHLSPHERYYGTSLDS